MITAEKIEDDSYPYLRVHRQSDLSRCGIAVIRSVLDSQYGISESEEEVVETIGWRRGLSENQSLKRILRDGIPPQDMADHFKDRCPGKVKVFCSKNGNAAHLDDLLREHQIVPVIHQLVSYREGEKLITEGHYMIFAGQNERTVRVFNPSPKEGFGYLPVTKFHHQWYNHCLGERWYLAVVPEGVTLDSKKFKGKYL